MDGNFGPTEQVLWPISVFSGIIMCKITYNFLIFVLILLLAVLFALNLNWHLKERGPHEIQGFCGSKGDVCSPHSHVNVVQLVAPDAYEITGQISLSYFKGYNKLSRSQKIEWNNRGFSTFHAIVAAAISFYLLFFSDTFKDGNSDDFVVDRKSVLSDAMFGISLGYFLTDLAMILWLFPSLGGKEYILHHGLSMYALLLSLISGKAQIYILMILFTEITTPFVNLRWYLDLAGQKSSMLYIYNGVALFLAWLGTPVGINKRPKHLNFTYEISNLYAAVARVLLFIYFFTHIYLHFDQVKTMFPLGFYSLMIVPSMLAVMNALWFRKIFRGMIKTISRKRHEH